MSKLGRSGRLWLRGFHILFICTWIGAAVSNRIIGVALADAADGGQLVAYHASIGAIDSMIIRPSAILTLVTGILLAWLTPWGFFKYRWVVYGEVIVVISILLGVILLGPWSAKLMAIAKAEGLRSLQNQEYMSTLSMREIAGTIQPLLLASAAFVSVIKPWRRREQTQVT